MEETGRWIGETGDCYSLVNGVLQYRRDRDHGTYKPVAENVTFEAANEYVNRQGTYRCSRGGGRKIRQPRRVAVKTWQKAESSPDLTPDQQAEIDERIEWHRVRIEEELSRRGLIKPSPAIDMPSVGAYNAVDGLNFNEGSPCPKTA